ncbi:MAG TPA: peptidase S10 [Candidatus Angelobacter sp.]|nr:peptidase S10 [Candidatus Angelobacter sp.]
MTMKRIVFGLIAVQASAYLALAQANPQQPSRTRTESQQPPAQITIPEAQQPQQQRERQRTRNPMESQPQSQAEPATSPANRKPPEEKSVVTHHSARIGGQQINYTATAATYVIKSDDGTPKASMFYVAYIKDGSQDISRRPISFVYNGGPGSASLFTHMGMGPKRPVLSPDGHGSSAPYSVVDNEDSFLDATDLVFIDAISTGFSRPAPGENPAQFHGIIPDANWFADFIYQYVTRNERWASPKFLIGESYGTTRSAELAGVIQQKHQMYLNGVVLVSAVAFASWGADDRSEFYLPTYTATAWYHHLLAPDLQNLTIEQVAQRAREFAHGEYAAALQKGEDLPPAEYKKIVEQIARFTALSPKYIEQTNLRIAAFRWFKELLRDKRLTVGRLDSRFTGMDVDAAGERNEYDSSEASYEGVYVGTFQDYVRRELKWESDLYYTVTANVRPWDQTGDTAVAEVLRSAMTQQTHLKLLVVCGYYDVATPFDGIERTVSHMHLEPPVRKNVSFAYYEAGHMMYIDDKERHKLHKDIDDFINSSYKH